ncbi:hypothetical protein L1887_48190 [Cichorium endivia]|nr:hypothetical protein L1887_48190 [Cichorium endivia]
MRIDQVRLARQWLVGSLVRGEHERCKCPAAATWVPEHPSPLLACRSVGCRARPERAPLPSSNSLVTWRDGLAGRVGGGRATNHADRLEDLALHVVDARTAGVWIPSGTDERARPDRARARHGLGTWLGDCARAAWTGHRSP